MCFHAFCAAVGIFKHKKINVAKENEEHYYNNSTLFLVCFPVTVTPIFWITYIVKTHHVLDPIRLHYSVF